MLTLKFRTINPTFIRNSLQARFSEFEDDQKWMDLISIRLVTYVVLINYNITILASNTFKDPYILISKKKKKHES